MKKTVRRLPIIVTSVVLASAVLLLAAGRLEYCGQAKPQRAPVRCCRADESRQPTLAPPRKVVFVQVESDKLDLEIRWAE